MRLSQRPALLGLVAMLLCAVAAVALPSTASAQIRPTTHFSTATKICPAVGPGATTFTCTLNINLQVNYVEGELTTIQITGPGGPPSDSKATYTSVVSAGGSCPISSLVVTSKQFTYVSPSGCAAGTTIILTESLAVASGGGGPFCQYLDSENNFPAAVACATTDGSTPFTIPLAPPTLAITKGPGNDTVQYGQTKTWNVVVTNNGPSATSGTVTVTDTVPANYTNVQATGAGWNCVITGNAIACTRTDSLAATQSYQQLVITATANQCAAAPIANTATVSGGGATNSPSATASTTIPCPTLAISKTPGGDTLPVGQTKTWSVTVTNNGPGTTYGTLTVNDQVPLNYTNVQATGTGWNCTVTGNAVSCTRTDNRTSGQSYPPIAITATASSCSVSPIANTATVSGGGAVNPASSTVSTTIPCPNAVLAITKGPGGDTVPIGQTKTWNVVVSNSGTGGTSGTVTVTDTVPSNFTAVTASGGGWNCTSGNSIQCNRSDTLGAGQSYPAITITGRATTCSTTAVQNTATVSGGGATGSPSATAVTTIPCGAPVLQVSKTDTVDPLNLGGLQTWQITVLNSSAFPTAGAITLTDNLPANFAAATVTGSAGWNCSAGGNVVSCTRADVIPANTGAPTITISARAIACGTALNTVNVNGGGATAASASQGTTIICPSLATIESPFERGPVVAPPQVERPLPVPPPAVIPPVTPPTTGGTTPPTTMTTQPPATMTTQPPAMTAPPTMTTQPPTMTTQPPTMTTQPPAGTQFQGVRHVETTPANPNEQLEVGKRTRLRSTWEVTNNTNEMIDLSSTVVFNLTDESEAVRATPSKGTATITGKQVSWGGFVLAPRETASIVLDVDITPTAETIGRPVVIVASTETTGRTASGAFISLRGTQLDTSAVRGLASGGAVLSPAAPSGPGAPGAPIAPAARPAWRGPPPRA
ncbi:MAG: DUF11 domain-containing protein [Dehalococcoidia bacterium]